MGAPAQLCINVGLMDAGETLMHHKAMITCPIKGEKMIPEEQIRSQCRFILRGLYLQALWRLYYTLALYPPMTLTRLFRARTNLRPSSAQKTVLAMHTRRPRSDKNNASV